MLRGARTKLQHGDGDAKIMRKTAAITTQVVSPYLNSNARFQARLVDFDTASYALTDQHKAWLHKTMLLAKDNSMYRIRLVGYASKLDNATKNSNLSYARIDAALKYLQTQDQNAMDRTETFRAVGEAGYFAPENDNSPEYRAVEVHIFIGDIPPPPPTQVIPVHHPLPDLPGGPRFTDWEVASPGGVFVGTGVGGGLSKISSGVPSTEQPSSGSFGWKDFRVSTWQGGTQIRRTRVRLVYRWRPHSMNFFCAASLDRMVGALRRALLKRDHDPK